jgi:hypothetical protein
MNVTRCVLLVLASALIAAAKPAELDGSVPLKCTAQRGHDCLPSEGRCQELRPQLDVAPVFGIDFAKKQVRSPYRTSLLHISQQTTTPESLVLQGTDLLFAWSAVINRRTGALTVSIADRTGAYVVFGQCGVVAAPESDELSDPEDSRPLARYAGSPAELVARSVRAAD